MPHNDLPLPKRLATRYAHNDRRVAVRALRDVDWVFPPADLVEALDHAELCRCEGEGGEELIGGGGCAG